MAVFAATPSDSGRPATIFDGSGCFRLFFFFFFFFFWLVFGPLLGSVCEPPLVGFRGRPAPDGVPLDEPRLVGSLDNEPLFVGCPDKYVIRGRGLALLRSLTRGMIPHGSTL